VPNLGRILLPITSLARQAFALEIILFAGFLADLPSPELHDLSVAVYEPIDQSSDDVLGERTGEIYSQTTGPHMDGTRFVWAPLNWVLNSRAVRLHQRIE